MQKSAQPSPLKSLMRLASPSPVLIEAGTMTSAVVDASIDPDFEGSFAPSKIVNLVPIFGPKTTSGVVSPTIDAVTSPPGIEPPMMNPPACVTPARFKIRRFANGPAVGVPDVKYPVPFAEV